MDNKKNTPIDLILPSVISNDDTVQSLCTDNIVMMCTDDTNESNTPNNNNNILNQNHVQQRDEIILIHDVVVPESFIYKYCRIDLFFIQLYNFIINKFISLFESYNNFANSLNIRTIIHQECVPTTVLTLNMISKPLIAGDYYYAIMDDSCNNTFISNSHNNTESSELIDISTFLFVGFIMNLLFGTVYAFASLYFKVIDIKTHPKIFLPIISLIYVIEIFQMVWNIVGGIIFWKNTIRTSCSDSKYIFIFISLIIKYMFNFVFGMYLIAIQLKIAYYQ